MSWNSCGRTISGRLFAGAGALTMALGLSGCLLKGPPPPPPSDSLPKWSSTTVSFLHTPTGPVGAATGWITTVTIPVCTDAEGATTRSGSVNNGSLSQAGVSSFTWTRDVTGSPPVTRVAGTFTANCKDSAGQTAHPTLSVPG